MSGDSGSPALTQSRYWILLRLRVLLCFELYRVEQAELAVSTSAVVPDLEVAEDRVRQVEAGVPELRSDPDRDLRPVAAISGGQ